MATFKKLKTGRWQAQVAREGVRIAKSFPAKAEARDWAARQEYLITSGQVGKTTGTVGDLFARYAQTVSPKRAGARWEIIRLKRLKKEPISQIPLRKIQPSHFAEWRDNRLQEVSPATVRREMNLISAVFSIARREWGVIGFNPLSDVRSPPDTPPRNRRVSETEIAQLLAISGSDLSKKTAISVHAFLLAIETAMRAGEICNMQWDHIDFATRVVFLPKTKNGDSRSVPLSLKAVELLDALPRVSDYAFNISSDVLSSTFRSVWRRAGIKDLTFHDSRHEAITRLSKKLNVLSLARMVGHKDIKMLQVYYNESAADMVALLD